MADYMIIAILVPMIGAAIGYIIKAKKRGDKCIGCSAAGTCSSKGKASSTCGISIAEAEKIAAEIKNSQGSDKRK